MRGFSGMAQMSVEEILMTYLPLEEDARELVDRYYRVSPLPFTPNRAFLFHPLLILLPIPYLDAKILTHRPLAGSPISSPR